jgi:hypothetical protein
MNYHYLGDGEGRFTESALLAGVGFNDTGSAESSMGVEIGDLDGDGLSEIFLTHLDQQTNTLYRNLGGGLFTDITQDSGLASSSLAWVGFGTVFFDYDNDADLDIVVANGHIIDNIELFDAARSHRQPGQLFENLGSARFTDISNALGLTDKLVGRGAAAADLDRDGDLDLVIAQNDSRALVLLNQSGKEARSVAFRLRGERGNPQGFGARLELRAGAHAQVREARSSSGYLSQGPPVVHFGLGTAQQVDELRVRWPSGQSQRYLSLRSGFVYKLYEKKAVPTNRSTPPG